MTRLEQLAELLGAWEEASPYLPFMHDDAEIQILVSAQGQKITVDGALEALDRGYGRRLSREEAKGMVRKADKAGLMHTADSEWRERGLHAICNCCACDCYPFRAAQELGSKGAWPKSRYVAVYDPDQCNLFGACVKRCHFDAFYHDGSTVQMNGRSKKQVLYNQERCWRCGLCANTCPSRAIVMEPLVQASLTGAPRERA